MSDKAATCVPDRVLFHGRERYERAVAKTAPGRPAALPAWLPDPFAERIAEAPTGEKAGARDTMDRMAVQMRDNGASSDWAERHSRTAARLWDRGVDSGTIQRPPRS